MTNRAVVLSETTTTAHAQTAAALKIAFVRCDSGALTNRLEEGLVGMGIFAMGIFGTAFFVASGIGYIFERSGELVMSG